MGTSALSEMPMPLFTGHPVEQGVAPGTAKPAPLPSYIQDHRKRLRERFLSGGPDAMPDYELLEMLLFAAVTRQDVKPLARRLLDTFGDLNAVITAPPPRLRAVEGVGDVVICTLKLAEAFATRLARAKVLDRPVLSSWDALLDYCHTAMSHNQVEQVRVLYLDKKNRLIADESTGTGTVDHVPLYPREVLHKALDLQASALIVVHNHPSGDPSPSQADIAMTHHLSEGAQTLGLVLHDHLIIGRSSEFSFRANGHL